MKMNIPVPEEEDDDFEFLPPDIDTELGYDGSGHAWQCKNHVPIFPKHHWGLLNLFYFCSNCTLRKNCPAGKWDSVSMNYDLISADFIMAENRLVRLNDRDHDDLGSFDPYQWDD